MLSWKVLDSGLNSAEENMRLDAALLANLGEDPILHFYDWEREALTYGHFAKPEELLDLQAVARLGLDRAKRPTGGGVVFHLWDLAFSVLIPASCPLFSQNTLENYAFVNQVVLEVVREFLGGAPTLTPEDTPVQERSWSKFCMAQPTKYDVVLGGKKVAGAAQRRTNRGFLHQGTIALAMPDEAILEEVLAPNRSVIEGMLRYTLPLLGNKTGDRLMVEVRKELQERLRTVLVGDANA